MENFQRKILVYLTNIENAYKDEEDREETEKINLIETELTDDLTALLFAMFLHFQRLLGEEAGDLLAFIHLCNRLAVQYLLENREKESQ